MRAMLTAQACEGAIKVFSKNLEQLLLAPPIKGKVALGLDLSLIHISWASLTEMPRSLPRLKAPLPDMMPKLMAFAEERICPWLLYTSRCG